MNVVHYSIHSLVEVMVDSRVSDGVFETIDFQIGYFKTSGGNPPCSSRIIVKPYEDFSLDPSLTWHSFHLVRGITGQSFDDPVRRIAFQKEERGYTIYADNAGFLINLFLQFLLIEHGISLVHAAAVADRHGRVTLLPGAGGVGKSTLLGDMVKNHNYRILGDDIVGLSEQGDCLSFPRSFALKEESRSIYPEAFQRLDSETQAKAGTSTRAAVSKLKRLTKENAPFIGLLKGILRRLGLLDKVAQHFPAPKVRPFLAAMPVEDVFGPDVVIDRGSIDRIIFLQRYTGTEFRVDSMSEEALCRRMFAILNHEWVSTMGQLFTMGALEIVDLLAYFERVSAVIRSGISGKKCEMLLIPDNASPGELADYFFISMPKRRA